MTAATTTGAAQRRRPDRSEEGMVRAYDRR
jgi:hypothetical protein